MQMWQRIQHFLYAWCPSLCLVCDLRSDQNLPLCHDCEAALPYLEKACLSCARPYNLSGDNPYCTRCQHETQPHENMIAAFRYEGFIRTWIHLLKFQHQHIYASLLGRLMVKRLRLHYQKNPLPQCILPIPLHNDRLKIRGFNQAVEIAKPIAYALSLPIIKYKTHRIKSTLPQTLISLRERKTNVNNAFSVDSIPYQHVAILDDVVTLGTTTKAFADTLKQQGVEKIDIWTVARTIFQ